MRVTAVVGRDVDRDVLAGALAGVDAHVSRHASGVSRGVRQLDRHPADLFLVAPDAADGTWPRAVRRAVREYAVTVLVLGPDNAGWRTDALDAGAWAYAEHADMESGRLADMVGLIARCVEAEARADQCNFINDWVEETGRLASWWTRDDGSVVFSRGMAALFGCRPDELGDGLAALREFVHPDDRAVYDQAGKATFNEKWPVDFEYRIVTPQGQVRHLHVNRRVELDDGGNLVRAYGLARDVSSRKNFEEFLHTRDALLQVVSRFAGSCLRGGDRGDAMDSIVRTLGMTADVTRVFICRRRADMPAGCAVSLEFEWAAPGIPVLTGQPGMDGLSLSPAYDRWQESLLAHHPIAGHVHNFPEAEQALFDGSGVRSLLLVPVFSGDEWWGFIGFFEHRRERDWLPAEIEALTMVADLLGSAILRSRMERQLREANEAAEEAKRMALDASKAKSRFLANMSHEIRTPISGILGMAEMTITTGLTPEQREHLDMIRDAARSLLAVVNDILDISKIEASRMELRPVPFDFRRELETTLKPFEPQAKAGNLVFLWNVADDVPAHLEGDPERLGQVLRNLVGNGLKFTERGLVELSVGVAEQVGDQICLHFSVRDTGEGIPEDRLEDIFDSFTQVDSSMGKRHQGTGLGLAISRELVAMMGGTVSAESEPGRGSVFSFTAWFGITDKVPEAAPEQKEPLRPLHLRLLLAEDNPLNRKFLTHFLGMFGHEVTVAGNGREALDLLERTERPFDLVLMDVQMPEMGGIEATRAIRAHKGRRVDPNIPIIALTAYAMKGDKERMLEAGMNDYVSKPVDMKELSAAIARNVRRPGDDSKAAPARSGRRTERVSEPQVADVDMDALAERFQGNTTLLRDILKLFLAEASDKLDMLESGLLRSDPDEAGAALHSMANLAGHVLAMPQMQKARSLERLCIKGRMAEAVDDIRALKEEFAGLVIAVRRQIRTL
ncbi:hybrid sensor histidine kinase/response regulator [Pseudodesulfovibrio tunisiensis]|uniref:hybrid sensor histidine kinase/response regulator n=1 Tax=Pseudodesulfovibrio tunisiensis TaxID=463192 RepID=UPI001FB2D7E4|nr:response regulator [Pseudodesulfovibrio tunisiensis]